MKSCSIRNIFAVRKHNHLTITTIESQCSYFGVSKSTLMQWVEGQLFFFVKQHIYKKSSRLFGIQNTIIRPRWARKMTAKNTMLFFEMQNSIRLYKLVKSERGRPMLRKQGSISLTWNRLNRLTEKCDSIWHSSIVPFPENRMIVGYCGETYRGTATYWLRLYDWDGKNLA